MFTGIIEELGVVTQIWRKPEGMQLAISCKEVLHETNIGDSIACNGVCLTVTRMIGGGFIADVMNETAKVTNVGALKQHSIVNLERAMAANGRFSGHIVSGHIDCQEKVLKVVSDGFATILHLSKQKEIQKNIVLRGSVTINGVSLTVMENTPASFSVSIIPHTQKETNLQLLKIADWVNIEVDIFSKYIQSFLGNSAEEKKESMISETFLRANGF